MPVEVGVGVGVGPFGLTSTTLEKAKSAPLVVTHTLTW